MKIPFLNVEIRKAERKEPEPKAPIWTCRTIKINPNIFMIAELSLKNFKKLAKESQAPQWKTGDCIYAVDPVYRTVCYAKLKDHSLKP